MANDFSVFSYDPPTPKNQVVDLLNAAFSKDVTENGKVGHYHKRGAPGQGADLEAEDIGVVPPEGMTSDLLQPLVYEFKSLIDLGRIHLERRQTTLQGVYDHNEGRPLYLSEVPGQLQVRIIATSDIPAIFSISGGNDPVFGEINYIISYTEITPAWTLPPNKSFLQLYIEYNPVTKTVSYGYTELETQYESRPYSGISNGQHFYDRHATNKMYVYNSDTSSWEPVVRLMVGEAVTGASTVTDVFAYAINGRYKSPRLAVAQGFPNIINHNLGCRPAIITKMGASTSSTPTNTSDLCEFSETSLYIDSINRRTLQVMRVSDNKLKNGSNAVEYTIFADRGW